MHDGHVKDLFDVPIPNSLKIFGHGYTSYNSGLRIVHTQAILFLKSMSERGGSDSEFE